MMETVIDYLWSNKYILCIVGILYLYNVVQSWKIWRMKKKINDFEVWSRELYDYISEFYQRRG